MNGMNQRSFVSRVFGKAVSILLAACALYWAACLIRAAWVVLVVTGGVLFLLGTFVVWYRARWSRW
jgi:hypothetical protein